MNTLIKPPCTNGTVADKQIDSRLAMLASAETEYTYLILTRACSPSVKVCRGKEETKLLRHMYSYLFEAASLGLSSGGSFTASLVKVPTKYAQIVSDTFECVQASNNVDALNNWLSQYNGTIIETHDIPEDYIPTLVILSEDGYAYIGTESLTGHNDFYECPFEEGMSVWAIVGHILQLLDNRDSDLLTSVRCILRQHVSTSYKVACISVNLGADDIQFNSWFKIDNTQELYDALEIDDEIVSEFSDFKYDEV